MKEFFDKNRFNLLYIAATFYIRFVLTNVSSQNLFFYFLGYLMEEGAEAGTDKFYKKLLLIISQYSQEITCVGTDVWCGPNYASITLFLFSGTIISLHK